MNYSSSLGTNVGSTVFEVASLAWSHRWEVAINALQTL